jgi:hypothetical protein
MKLTVMGKDNIKALDSKVPVPFIQEEEKEADESDGKPPAVKLLLDANGETIDNPMTHIEPIFNGGTEKVRRNNYSNLEGQPVSEHFRLAL